MWIKTDNAQETVVKNIFAQLELRFGLLRETTPKYTQYQYKELALPSDNTPAGESIRKASKKAKAWTHIDVDTASRIRQVPRGTIIAKLNDWNERGYIQLDAKGVENVYLVLKPLPTTVQERNSLADSVYKELEIREQQDLARMDQVTDLITGQQCFALSLAKHFGDELPENKQATAHGARTSDRLSSRSRRRFRGTLENSPKCWQPSLIATMQDTSLVLHLESARRARPSPSCPRAQCLGLWKTATSWYVRSETL
jgi:hypothetical protein